MIHVDWTGVNASALEDAGEDDDGFDHTEHFVRLGPTQRACVAAQMVQALADARKYHSYSRPRVDVPHFVAKALSVQQRIWEACVMLHLEELPSPRNDNNYLGALINTGGDGSDPGTPGMHGLSQSTPSCNAGQVSCDRVLFV